MKSNFVTVTSDIGDEVAINTLAIASVSWRAGHQTFNYREDVEEVGFFWVQYMGGGMDIVRSNPLDLTDDRGPTRLEAVKA